MRSRGNAGIRLNNILKQKVFASKLKLNLFLSSKFLPEGGAYRHIVNLKCFGFVQLQADVAGSNIYGE